MQSGEQELVVTGTLNLAHLPQLTCLAGTNPVVSLQAYGLIGGVAAHTALVRALYEVSNTKQGKTMI